jgi:hypothetical protein
LHLLGYDHETDRGEMTALELSLRERLAIAGRKERCQVTQANAELTPGAARRLKFKWH